MPAGLIFFVLSLGSLGLWASVEVDLTAPAVVKVTDRADIVNPAPTLQQGANASAQKLPLRKDSVIPQKTLIRVLIAVIIGLILAFAIAYLLKKYLFVRDLLGSDEQRIQLLEVRRLTPRLTLFMVRVDDKTMVLAQSGERLVALDSAKSFNAREAGNEK
jgi:flagellar biogenesis protein FliO